MQDYVSISKLDAEEKFSTSKIQTILKDARSIISRPNDRPKDSYINLLDWVFVNFSKHLSSKKVNKFVHNKIVIDGAFLLYCDEVGAKVKCIYDDSIISWRSEYDNEKFFMQGIFTIESKKCKFLHFALFQKGNQNEDEISFGILVSDELSESYIDFRNNYEDWLFKRDRSNFLIKVIDGEDIPYTKDFKWEDLFLPDELKSNIRLTVEGFLKSKNLYEKQNIPWKRGILLHGTAGCGKTSLIKTIISNYDFKPITILPGSDDNAMREAFSYAQDQNPALLYFEDLDSLLESINLSLFLNLMDGISTKNGLFIVGTANSLEKFSANIKDRPSRFDRKFEIPIPDESMAFKYFRKWFNNKITDKEIDKLVSYTVRNKFSYSHIKEVYISSAYAAIANDREEPNIDDIMESLKQLIADKFAKNKPIGLDKYINNKSK